MVIAVSLINGVFAVLVALIPFIISWLANLRKPGWKRPVIFGISILVVFAVACVATFFFARHVIHPSPQATITVPAGSSAAPTDIRLGDDIEGSASNLPHDQLFLVLRSTGGGGLRYYPQAQVTGWIGANWTGALDASPGAGRYDLMAIDATAAEAHGKLQMYLQICRETATCKGVDTLPEGVEILASVPVNVIP
jgi:hypothetical protein